MLHGARLSFYSLIEAQIKGCSQYGKLSEINVHSTRLCSTKFRTKSCNGFLQEHNSSCEKFPLKISNPLQSINFLLSRKYTTDATVDTIPGSDKLITNELADIIDEFNRNVANGNPLTQYELKILLNRLKTQRPTADEALKILELCSYGRTGQKITKIVTHIWHELHSAGSINAHEFDVQHYNCMLKFASDRQDANYAHAIFDQMIADGIEPNAISYEYLLAVYCKSGNMEKTSEILNENRLPLSERAYNYMIQCFIVSGTVNNISGMLEKANTRVAHAQFKINRDTLITALNHFAQACDFENCRKAVTMFETLNVELLNFDVFNVMCKFCINRHADQCNSWFEYFKPNSEMKPALHDATTLFVRSNCSRHFVEIFEKLLNDGLVSIDAKPIIYKQLIHEMCTHNVPVDEFEATIEPIESNGFRMEENFESFESALKCSSPKFIQKLLLYMKENGLQITEMEFEKLFELAAMTPTSMKQEDVLNLVNSMCLDFRIQPTIIYIRDVILPAILNTNTNSNDSMPVVTAANQLLDTKIFYHRTLNALINISLSRYDFKTAIHLINQKKCFYAKKIITAPLLDAYAHTGDVRSFVEILCMICQSFTKINYYQPHKLSQGEIKQWKMAFVDEMLTVALAHSLADERRLAKLLFELGNVKDEFAINSKQFKKIEQQISESMNLNQNLQINRLLERLMSAKNRRISSELVNQHRPYKGNAQIERASAAEIKKTLDEQRALGRDVSGTEKLLFWAYLHEENVPQVEAMLSGAKLNLTNANYAMLVSLYTRHGNLEKALNMLHQAHEKDSTFQLYPIELAQLISLMYDHGQFDFNEIHVLLQRYRQEKIITTGNIPFERLLQRLATDGHAQHVQQLFDALVKFHYIQATPWTTGALITVHLSNGAFDLAIQKYQDLADKYNFVPMSGTLFKILIQNEQNDLLKRAMEIHKNVHGKSAAWSHLAFAYSELGRTEQARKIFESGRIDDLTVAIGKVCIRYARKDDLESAKLLLKSTEGISMCDSRKIYQTILDIYQKYDKADAALELWINISNSNTLPTPEFLDKLAKLLRTNNIELPADLQNKIKRQNW